MRVPAALVALLCVAVLAGCGGSDDSSNTGAKQFLHKGSDNSIQESGREASESQLDQAAGALHGYLDAVARQDWPGACGYVARQTYEQIAVIVRLEGKPCPKVLGAFFAAVPSRNLVAAARADVGSFRVDGDRGFVLYRGAKAVDYAMPMALEGGSWKVAALAGSALL